MNDNERFKRTTEIMAKFPNSEERMRQSPLFHTVIQMLVRLEDPYLVIDQLINNTEDMQKALEQYVHRDTRPIAWPEKH